MTTVWRGEVKHAADETQEIRGTKAKPHHHRYYAEVLNQQGVALQCFCRARAQWISTCSLRNRPTSRRWTWTNAYPISVRASRDNFGGDS